MTIKHQVEATEMLLHAAKLNVFHHVLSARTLESVLIQNYAHYTTHHDGRVAMAEKQEQHRNQ